MFPAVPPTYVFSPVFRGKRPLIYTNAYHGSAYFDFLFGSVQQTGSGMFPIVCFLQLMLSVGDIGFLSDSAYGVSFTAFFHTVHYIAQQFCIVNT